MKWVFLCDNVVPVGVADDEVDKGFLDRGYHAGMVTILGAGGVIGRELVQELTARSGEPIRLVRAIRSCFPARARRSPPIFRSSTTR
jgi:hypothetical protein